MGESVSLDQGRPSRPFSLNRRTWLNDSRWRINQSEHKEKVLKRTWNERKQKKNVSCVHTVCNACMFHFINGSSLSIHTQRWNKRLFSHSHAALFIHGGRREKIADIKKDVSAGLDSAFALLDHRWKKALWPKRISVPSMRANFSLLRFFPAGLLCRSVFATALTLN